MIVVTGAAGFIGSCLIGRLNAEGYNHVIAVDRFNSPQKNNNLKNKRLKGRIDRDFFFSWIEENHKEIEFIFHLGARTDTAEMDYAVLEELNTEYTKKVWQLCCKYHIPLVYASSAATYGDGSLGYKDDDALPESLSPLNPYGKSKNEFDKWAVVQEEKPFFWAGLKFFNVFGPNENHKGRMASVVFQSFKQIQENGGVKLFKSHKPEFADGCQTRDFVYVKDVVEVCLHLMRSRAVSGLFNVGTGEARTFLDLTKAVFKTLKREEDISFIDTPEDIRDKYQYHTEAEMDKLKATGYKKPFWTLENAVADYVGNYLFGNKFY